MPNNILVVTIVVGLIALIVGGGLGYLGAILENRLNKALDDGREVTDPNDPDYETHKPVLNVDEHDVLKITVDPMLRWRLTLDGASLEPDGLTAEQRARLVNVIVQIRPWIDGKTAPAPYIPPAPIAVPAPAFPDAPIGLQALPPTPTLRVDVRRGFRSLLESDVKKPEPLLENNIIRLIDEVLQKKLESSQLLAKRIRIEAGKQGEVVVFVGASRYIGIDSVPDPDIRAIIEESIKEWNSK